MSLVTQISNLAVAAATQCKTLAGKIGDLASLATTSKTSAVSAINELVTSITGKIDSTKIGANNGVAPLDSSGRIPIANLPSSIDEIVEYANHAAFPGTGATQTLYLALDTNHIWRWTGSTYVDMTGASGGVSSFNTRTGAVVPTAGDYDAMYFTETEIGDITHDFAGDFTTALT